MYIYVYSKDYIWLYVLSNGDKENFKKVLKSPWQNEQDDVIYTNNKDKVTQMKHNITDTNWERFNYKANGD